MKIYTINKIGYTAGVYGCSGEYFNCIAIDTEKSERGFIGFTFSGMYGAESRVSEALKKLGYESKYTPMSTYGKLTKKDISKNVYSEYTVIANIQELLDRGYIEYNKEYRKKAGLSKINK